MSGRPINRAVRLEVKARIEMARHGATLLKSKEEALERERDRLVGHSTRTAEEWTRRCADAQSWLQRSRGLGAGPDIEALLERPGHPARVDIAWQTAMGVAYPGEVSCHPDPAHTPAATAALRPTTDAFAEALTAGAEHAAARVALARLERELSVTRRRRRAIEKRLVPDLEATLHRLDIDLDERDRESAVRSRLAIRSQEGRR